MASSSNVTPLRPEFADYAATPGDSGGFDINKFKRWAGEQPLRAMEVVGLARNTPRGRVPAYGRLAGLGTLLALADAGTRLADPTQSPTQNVLEAGGALGGNLAGGALGAMAGAALVPFAPPVGMLVGSALGASMLSPFGEGLGNMLAGFVEGSPESKLLAAERKRAEMAIDLQAQQMAALMPYEQIKRDMAYKDDARRAAEQARLRNDAALRDSMNQAFLAQTQNSAQNQALLTQAILGGGMG